MRRWLFFFFIALLYAYAVAAWAQESSPNRVLFLDGDGDYVEMADSEALNSINSQVTMEAWIKPAEPKDQWSFIVYKGDKRISDQCENRSYTLMLNSRRWVTQQLCRTHTRRFGWHHVA